MSQVEVLIQGVLEKKKRKALQGYARRYFVLGNDGILRYSARQGEKFRDSISIHSSSIGRSAKNFKIVIDDGSKVFHIKALNDEDFQQWTAAFHNFTQVKASTEEARHEESPTSTSFADTATGIFKSHSRNPSAASRSSDPGGAQQASDDNGPHLIDNKTAEEIVDMVAKMTVTIKKLEKAVNPNAPESDDGSSAGIASRLYNTVSSAVSAPQADMELISNTISSLKSQHAHVLSLLENSHIVTDDKHVTKLQRAESLATASSSSSTEDLYHDAEAYDFLDDDTDAGLTSSSMSRSTSADTDTSADTSNSSSDEGGYDDASDGNSSDTTQHGGSDAPVKGDKQSSHVKRRHQLPHPVAGDEVSLFGLLKKNMGKDLSKISFPVTLNEPLSQLQSMAEDLEYTELLDTAAKQSDALQRLLYVTAFVVSGYSKVKYRGARKPFNPMLGETFELVRPDKGFKLVAEKVEHHPNWTACNAQGKGWDYTSTASGAQKFWGRTFELIPEGITEIRLKEADEVYTVSRPPSYVRNIMSGEKYIEHVGDLTVTCSSSGMRAKVNFKEGSSWGGASSRNKIEGKLFDENDSPQMELGGKWDESIFKKTGSKSSETVWTVNDFPSDAPKYYGFSSWAVQLNELTSDLDGVLPPTDSRLRPDQRAFEEGKVSEAEDGKSALENRQRERRKDWESKPKEERPPQFFEKKGGDDGAWKYKGGYWEKREKGDWNDSIKVFEM